LRGRDCGGDEHGTLRLRSARRLSPRPSQTYPEPVKIYIVAFREDRWGAALVVEVDGDIHDLQQEEDTRREKDLGEMGLQIVRFRNDEVVRDLAGVVRQGMRVGI
jgi:very-short-patch-repair endonuclease